MISFLSQMCRIVYNSQKIVPFHKDQFLAVFRIKPTGSYAFDPDDEDWQEQE